MRITAEDALDMSSRDLELGPFRAVCARVAVLEFSTAVADPYHAVDTRLHVILPRGRAHAQRGLLIRQCRFRQSSGLKHHHYTGRRRNFSRTTPHAISHDAAHRRIIGVLYMCSDDEPVTRRRKLLWRCVSVGDGRRRRRSRRW